MDVQIIMDLENDDIESKIEGILFAAGEPVTVSRLSEVLDADDEIVLAAAVKLRDQYSFGRRGIRLVVAGESLQLCSSPEFANLIRLALEKRKPPQLSQTALEVLAVVAYFQPVTRAYIESIRGVDCSYTVGALQERELIEKCGTLQVPGRPTLYRTTGVFLRTFGIESTDELQPLPEVETDNESRAQIQSAIEALQNEEIKKQFEDEVEEGQASLAEVETVTDAEEETGDQA